MKKENYQDTKKLILTEHNRDVPNFRAFRNKKVFYENLLTIIYSKRIKTSLQWKNVLLTT